eukprot:1158088-Amphidinium_carterae.1
MKSKKNTTERIASGNGVSSVTTRLCSSYKDASSFAKKPQKPMPEPEAEYGSPFLCYPMVTVKPPRPEADTGQDEACGTTSPRKRVPSPQKRKSS